MPSLLSRLRAATDTFYDRLYFSASLSVRAHREGMAKGLRGPALRQFVKAQCAAPPDDYKVKAIADARTRTAQRKLRGRCVAVLAAVLWLVAGGYWTVTNAVPALATVGYFVIGVAAVLVISGAFQVLFGLANLLRGLLTATYEWIVGGVTGRERVNAFDQAVDFGLTVLFGIAVFVLEAMTTLLMAHWVFENLV